MSFTNSLLLRRSSRPGVDSTTPPRTPEIKEKLGRVVIADSDTADLEHMASILRGMGFTVLTANDGRSAVGLVRRHTPVLVLATLDLPLINGYILAQKLREQPATESTPFMFILRAGEIPDQIVGHETFAHDYIQKPFSVPEFKSRVRALLNLVEYRQLPAEPLPEKEAPPMQRPSPPPEESAAAWLRQLRELLEEMAELVTQMEARLTAVVSLSPTGLEPLPRTSTSTRPTASIDSAGSPARAATEPHLSELDVGAGPSALDSSARRLALLEKLRAEFRTMGTEVSPMKTSPPESKQQPEDQVSPSPGTDFGFESHLGGRPEGGGEPPSLDRIVADEETEFARVSLLAVAEEEITSDTGSPYAQAREFVLKSLRRAAVGGFLELPRAERIVQLLADSLSESDTLTFEATRRDQPFSVSAHCVNVAILGIRLARECGDDRQAQSLVGLAGLLHELGIVRLPEKLVFKEASLTEEELHLLRRRPLASAMMLRETGRKAEAVAEIAGQVFEREDGSGHPLGLFGSEVRHESKLLALADVFEACIHRRPYRRPLSGYSALFELSQSAGFSRDLVKALVRSVSLFPPHEIIQLSGGEIAEVIGINPLNLSRPRVKIRIEASGAPVVEERELDLAQPGQPEVKRVLIVDDLLAKLGTDPA